MKDNSLNDLQKSYFDVLGLGCSSEVLLIEMILKPLEGVHHVSIIVPSRTVIVLTGRRVDCGWWRFPATEVYAKGLRISYPLNLSLEC
ncbi:hypothetical protein L2E82_16163 [Cichorium intybus]|uniref:Uncharacterized protein n=1 Tax=Cichorium intybus TaxID=13427 RepID=A0ACB9F5Q7_CICIN|nr:hypothetical protein L2E82_16163 [Cichorium intybus]